MTRDWFCQIAGRQYGPLTLEQLQRMARSGQLPTDAPVKQGEEGTWYYASTMPGVFPDAASEATPPSTSPDATPNTTSDTSPPATPLPSRATPPTGKTRAQTSRTTSRPDEQQTKPLAAAKNAKNLRDSAAFTDTQALAAADAPRTVVARPKAKAAPVAAAIPNGSVVPQPPLPQPPIPQGRAVIPQGVAVASPIGTGAMAGPPIVSSPAASRGSKGSHGGKRKGKDNKRMVLIGGGVTVGALVAFAVVMVLINSKAQPQKEGTKEVAAATDASSNDGVNGPGTNPATPLEKSTEKKKPEVAKEPVAKNGTKGKGENIAATAATAISGPEKVLKAISPSAWKDLAKVSGTTVKSDSQQIKLQILTAWFGGKTKAAEGEETKGGANRVFVEVTVTNLAASSSPLTYDSWNGKFGSNAQSVVVADDQYRAATFTPLNKTPEVARQTSPVRLQPGKSVTDVLVFEPAQADFEFLYLALPFNAVGSGDRPFAFKIPKTNILSERPQDVPDQVVKTQSAPPRNPGVDTVGRALANGGTEELPESAPAAVPPPMKGRPREMSDEEKIPSPADINKQIEEMRQKDLDARKKAKEAEEKSP